MHVKLTFLYACFTVDREKIVFAILPLDKYNTTYQSNDILFDQSDYI